MIDENSSQTRLIKASSNMMIEVISHIEKLKQFEPFWNKGIENSNFDSLFVTFEWIYVWAKHFANPDNLFIVVAHNDDTLFGVLPLLRTTKTIAGISYNVLQSMTNYESPRYNFVHQSPEILQAMLTYLNTQWHWDVMDLHFIPADEQHYPAITNLKGKCFKQMFIYPESESAFVAIQNTWDNYLNSLPKKIKKNLRYFEERLIREGGFEILTHTEPENLDEYLMEAFEIDNKSWRTHTGTTIFTLPGYKDFYTELAMNLCPLTRFELHFLHFNQQKVAFDYCVHYKNRYYVLKTAFNMDYSLNSPGRILKKKVLQRIFERQSFVSYDFVGIKDSWKKEWTSDFEKLNNIKLFSNTLKARLLYNLYLSKQTLKSNTKKIAHKVSNMIKIGRNKTML